MLVGKDVRERLVKHLEDKNEKAAHHPTPVGELSSIVNLGDGRYSASPTAVCNQGGPGKLLFISIYLIIFRN